jgi:transposase
VVVPHSRHTIRLATILFAFGVAVGGAPGARLLQELGIAVSGDTLRRAVRGAELPDVTTPRVLGVDDWSRRKGRTYGTILVDLERRRPIDLLPDSSAATFAPWLTEHPGIEIISRDRGGAYAEGARQGAPQAVQVADRWHLLKNLGDLLERLLVRSHDVLRQVQLQDDAPIDHPPAPAAPEAVTEERLTRTERARQRRNACREVRYRELHRLHEQGYGVRAIARHLQLSPTTVRKYLAAPTCPQPGPRPHRQRRITPYLSYLRQRWEAGEQRTKVLWADIREQGFTGSWRRVQEQLAVWRRAERQQVAKERTGVPTTPPALRPRKRCGPRQVAAWLVRPAAELTAAQQRYLAELVERCPAIGRAQRLAQAFTRIVRTRDDLGLEPWLQEAETSAIAEMEEFAIGIRRDQAAVQAALIHPWSQGQVEGQINRLKLVKRSMFGRAGFDFLRQRYLLAA